MGGCGKLRWGSDQGGTIGRGCVLRCVICSRVVLLWLAGVDDLLAQVSFYPSVVLS